MCWGVSHSVRCTILFGGASSPFLFIYNPFSLSIYHQLFLSIYQYSRTTLGRCFFIRWVTFPFFFHSKYSFRLSFHTRRVTRRSRMRNRKWKRRGVKESYVNKMKVEVRYSRNNIYSIFCPDIFFLDSERKKRKHKTLFPQIWVKYQ